MEVLRSSKHWRELGGHLKRAVGQFKTFASRRQYRYTVCWQQTSEADVSLRVESGMEDGSGVVLFDGHNDAIQFIAEYRADGRDFLERSDDGHLDLVRAREGGLIGGIFAMHAKPERAPMDDLTVSKAGYEVRLADPLAPAWARRQIEAQRDALSRLIARSAGQIRWAASVEDIEATRRDGAFVMVLHMEEAEAIGPDLDELEHLYSAGLRSLGLVWSRPNIFGHGVPFAYPRSPNTGPGLTPAGKELVRR
jgi:membrane dipeptidase